LHAAPHGFLRLDKVHTDPRALAFAGAATLFAAVLSGLLPALRPPHALAAPGRRVTSTGTAQLRQALTSLQLACSIVLLSGALLFCRSLIRLESQQPGFSQDHLTAVTLRLSRVRYGTPDRIATFDDRIEDRLKAIPGMQAVALSDSMPPSGSVLGRPLSNIKVAGEPSLRGASEMVALRYVTPDYFRTLGIPVQRGRTFTNAERGEPENTVVINETLARRLFPSEEAIGGRVSLNGGTQWVTVIGVVGDVKNNGINTSAGPEYYWLRTRHGGRFDLTTIAFLRSGIDTATLMRWVTKEVMAIDPTATVSFESMAERLRRLSDRPRFLTFVLLIFACVSVLLAGSGLYGVIAFLVGSRTREIGVRAALGATRLDIALMVQRQMVWCAVFGVAAGLLGSLALSGLVQGLLFHISPHDPLVLVSAAACAFAITILAAWKPAWKAAHIDPAEALRVD
jgi:predicted permease